MVRSHPRNNFLDILRDPLAVTVMASIGLHALVGAFLLPIFTRAQPEGKKAEPGTVKVVELTTTELQRIPQVPTPIPTTAPSRVTLPPVYQPSTPVAPKAPISTTIPATPIRTPTPTKTPKVSKTQPETPSAGVDFNPEIFNNPSPKPTKSLGKKGEIKPSPKPTPSIKTPQPTKKVTTKPSTDIKPKPEANTDDDGGGEGGQTQTPSPQQTKTSQNPSPATSTQPSDLPTPSPSESSPSSTNGNNKNKYGNIAQQVTDQLKIYYTKYPKLKTIDLKPKVLPYPASLPCSKLKPEPYIVYTPVFGPTPQNQDPNFGSTTAEAEEGRVFTSGTFSNKELEKVARNKASEEAFEAEKNRPEEYKKQYVVYSIKIEFDPATCKN